MKLGGNRPPGDNPLLFAISGTGSFISPVAQTRLDIPRPLLTQSRSTGGKAEMFSSAGGTRTDNTSVRSRTCYQLSHPGSPRGSHNPRSSTGGDLLPTGGIVCKEQFVSGGCTPCQHPRPSSGRELTLYSHITYSVWWYPPPRPSPGF